MKRRHFLSLLGLGTVEAITVSAPSAGSEAAPIIYEAPPTVHRPELVDPVVVKLGSTSSIPRLSTSQDYIIILPKTVARTVGVQLRGGRNIALIGGWLSTSSGLTMPNVLILDGAPGSIVHCEGLLIDGSHGGLSDAFHIQAPGRHVQLQMNRVDGLRGAYSKTHADCIQNLGCQSLSVEDFTGRSHYNNGYLRRENDPVGYPIGPSVWNRVNMGGYKTNQDASGTDPRHTLRALSLGMQPIPPGDPTSTVNAQLTGSVWLKDYYGDAAEAGLSLGQFVWPHDGARMSATCRAQVSADGQSVDWPAWRTTTYPPAEETRPSTLGSFGSGDAKVYGTVQLGPPPLGDYVTVGDVGLAYPRLA